MTKIDIKMVQVHDHPCFYTEETLMQLSITINGFETLETGTRTEIDQ